MSSKSERGFKDKVHLSATLFRREMTDGLQKLDTESSFPSALVTQGFRPVTFLL